MKSFGIPEAFFLPVGSSFGMPIAYDSPDSISKLNQDKLSLFFR